MIVAPAVGDIEPKVRPSRARPLPTRRIELSAEAEPEHLFRELIAAYLSGAGRIQVHQKGGIRIPTQAVVESFRARVGESVTLGEENDELVLQNLDPSERRSLAATTFRLGERVLELLREAGERSGEPLSESEWESQDDRIDRLAWEVHRQVSVRWQQGRPHPQRPEERIDPIGWLEASRTLERIGDHAVLIGTYGGQWLATGPGDAERRLLAEFQRQAFDYVTSALVLLGDPRPGPANAALDLGEALRATARTLLDRLLAARGSQPPLPPATVVALGWVLHSLERVVAYGEDLVEISLDHARPPPASSPSAARLTSRAMKTMGGTETR